MINTLIGEILDVVGKNGLISAADEMRPYLEDWRGRRQGKAHCVVLPASTEEVAAVVKIASRHGEPIFPLGGNTGLCFGAVPESNRAGHPGIVLSLRRMNKIREIDRIANLATVDAGVILAHLHEAADRAERSFPLRLGSEGSALIGGLISTNAGGTGVVRYGPMRDLTVGIEAVLADGSIYRDLTGLKKDNTGYLLRELFIGAEGTLGIITGATLRLHPKVVTSTHAWVALPSPAAATEFLGILRGHAETFIEAYELCSRSQFELVVRHIDRVRIPFAELPAWNLMIELGASDLRIDLKGMMEEALEAGLEAGLVENAVIASSEAQAEEIWHVRHSVSDANKKEGIGIVHDICVRVSDVPAFIAAADEVTAERFPNAVPMVVCHLGDGNVHYTVMFQRRDVPIDAEEAEVFALSVEKTLHDVAMRFGGTISAEHGIGRKLTSELGRLADPLRMKLMHELRGLFDPEGLMNPGVLLPQQSPTNGR